MEVLKVYLCTFLILVAMKTDQWIRIAAFHLGK
jgi:hypothetical protein